MEKFELEITKSKFIAYRLELNSLEQVKPFLESLKKEHKKANHVCWAGRMKNPFFEKAVDDGEPSGTAGRPILGVMQKKDKQNACIFVVRYFGGVKLGAGGLVRAYAKVAADLLAE